MQSVHTTLSKFLVGQLHDTPGQNDLVALLVDVAAAAARIADWARCGALGGVLGAVDAENHQGEVQQRLDLLAHEAMVEYGQDRGLLAGMASEELQSPCPLAEGLSQGRYL